ncbi:MAG TPA: ABC transporter permease [Aggregatilinea sp.]|jgi:NitT/TauT family transport system permease protein|uniref:ABC transporter permease n=1 Tax=Aggregatilinea sp. TaxID=2806333 RepID=UPI002B77CB21|nr:ABC transporter permease [Aggregatilinea sp.]HML24168.1 ABC transporter permease [Aggregatilinea sp.]
MHPTTPPARPAGLSQPRAPWYAALAGPTTRQIGHRLLNLLLAIGIFALCWIALAAYLNRDIMPYPWHVIPVFFEEMHKDLWMHTLASARRVLSAIAVSVVIATPVGLGLGQIRALNRIFSPLIALVYPIPKIVFLPVILVILGIGETSKVFLISIILFFQILVVVRDEAASIRPELLQSVRSLGAGRRALFRYVYVPASVPAVLTALRVSVGTAIAVLFIAEQYSTREGLGYYIVTLTWQRLRFDQMYAGILAMSLLGLVLYVVIDVLERIFGRWRYAGES